MLQLNFNLHYLHATVHYVLVGSGVELEYLNQGSVQLCKNECLLIAVFHSFIQTFGRRRSRD